MRPWLDTNEIVNVGTIESQCSFFAKLMTTQNFKLSSNSLKFVGRNMDGLDELDRQIILLLYECSEGLSAKQIGSLIHLSRFTILRRAKRLVLMHLADLIEISSPKTGIKPTYVFRITPEITQAIIHSIDEVASSVVFTPQLFPDFCIDNSQNNLRKIESHTLKQEMEFDELKKCLSHLNSTTRQVLIFIYRSENGTSSPEMVHELSIPRGTLHPHLKHIIQLSLAIRRWSFNSKRKEYVYSQHPALTLEIINKAFDSIQDDRNNFHYFIPSSNGQKHVPDAEELTMIENSNAIEPTHPINPTPPETTTVEGQNDSSMNQYSIPNHTLISMPPQEPQSDSVTASTGIQNVNKFLALFNQAIKAINQVSLLEEELRSTGDSETIKAIEQIKPIYAQAIERHVKSDQRVD